MKDLDLHASNRDANERYASYSGRLQERMKRR